MAETVQSGENQFSSVAFLAQGCGRLIARCERLEAMLSEKDAALKDQTSRKEDAFRRLEEVRTALKVQKAEYDKLAKSKLGRLTLWYWRLKDRRKA